MLQFFLVLEGCDCFSAKTFSLKNELDLAEKTKENINNDKTHLESIVVFLFCSVSNCLRRRENFTIISRIASCVFLYLINISLLTLCANTGSLQLKFSY